MAKGWRLGAIAALLLGVQATVAQDTVAQDTVAQDTAIPRLWRTDNVAMAETGPPGEAGMAPPEVQPLPSLGMAVPPPPPSALWLALMPLVPIAGGLLTHSFRVFQRRQRVRRRAQRQRLPPKPRWPR